MRYIKKRVIFLFLLILISLIISNIVSIETLPDYLRNIIWDNDKVAPILNIIFSKYLLPFISEILLIFIFLLTVGFIYLNIYLKTRNSKISVYINIFILMISSVPSFLLSLLTIRYNIINSDVLNVITISILGNMVLYFFLRKQRWYLTEELKKDYVKASIIRGDNILSLISKRYIQHMLTTIEELFSYIIMSLIISEISLNYTAGLTNMVFRKFQDYISDSIMYGYGVSYLIWMLIITYIILLILQRINEILVKSDNHNENSIINIDILKYNNSRDFSLKDFAWFFHSKRLITEVSDQSLIVKITCYVTRRVRSIANSLSINKEFSVVMVISLSILILLTGLGNSINYKDSYINRVIELEEKITYIEDSKSNHDSYYYIDYDNEKIVPLIYKSVYEESLNLSTDNNEEDKSVDQFGFDNMQGSVGSDISDDFFDLEFTSEDEVLGQNEKLSDVVSYGYSSWTRGDFKKYFYNSESIVKYFPLGTDSSGQSILKRVAIMLINYIKPVMVMILITVFGGILFAYINILLYKKKCYFYSKSINTFFITLDSIPKFILILLFLPFLNANFYGQEFMHYEFVFFGVIFIPVMYKQVYNKTMYYIKEDFIQAQEFIGASFNKIFFYHILLKNSIKQFTSNICEIISVSILIEASMGFLGLVVGKYDSIGSLLTMDKFGQVNIMEIFIPIFVICLIIISANLIIEIFQEER